MGLDIILYWKLLKGIFAEFENFSLCGWLVIFLQEQNSYNYSKFISKL